MYLIETNELTKRYGNNNAVDHVSMHIPSGSIYGFVGENGSGKTTIMRMLTGLANPTSGSFTINGVANTSNQIYKERVKMSAIVEATSLVPTMTAKQNMKYQSLYLGLKITEEKMDELLKMVHLENVGNKKVKNFSLGMRQRLGIAMALVNNPQFMLLDEPLNGLDPQGIAELRTLLIELNQTKNITILVSSHILSELEKVASFYGFIKKGKLIQEISASDLFAACTRYVSINVDDTAKAVKVLEEAGCKDIKISSSGEIQIFDEIALNKITKALAMNDIIINSINSNDQSVEDYYLNLIGGNE